MPLQAEQALSVTGGPRFQNYRHMNVVRLSAPAAFTTQ